MKEQNKETLKRALKHLPEYEAPEKIWIELQEQLNRKSILKSKYSYWYIARIAATIALIIGLGGYFFWEFFSQSELPYRIEAEQSIEKHIELESVQEVYIEDSLTAKDSVRP